MHIFRFRFVSIVLQRTANVSISLLLLLILVYLVGGEEVDGSPLRWVQQPVLLPFDGLSNRLGGLLEQVDGLAARFRNPRVPKQVLGHLLAQDDGLLLLLHVGDGVALRMGVLQDRFQPKEQRNE